MLQDSIGQSKDRVVKDVNPERELRLGFSE